MENSNAELSGAMSKAMAEANDVFDRLRQVVEEEVGRGATELNLSDVLKRAGMKIDERELLELRLPPIIYCHRWIPWGHWFPWRPLWCWHWRRYGWFHCCPWWWSRCHF